jgi:hypothetical protein
MTSLLARRSTRAAATLCSTFRPLGMTLQTFGMVFAAASRAVLLVLHLQQLLRSSLRQVALHSITEARPEVSVLWNAKSS